MDLNVKRDSADSLCDNCVRKVLLALSLKDVARVACVSERFRRLVADVEVRIFQRRWGFRQLIGRPNRPLNAVNLSHFVLQHRPQRLDTCMALSLKYGLNAVAIRVANNIISDHSLQSRRFVYIPVVREEQLLDKVVSVVRCPLSSREHLVVTDQEEQESGPAKRTDTQENSEEQSMFIRKLSQYLGKGLHIDVETAQYYLAETGGDVKAAIQLYQEDKQWDASGTLRRMPLSRCSTRA